MDAEKKSAKKRFPKALALVLFTLGGTGLGYLYYYFVGCPTGTCPISSNPVTMTLYGAAIGFLVGQIALPSKKKSGAGDR